MMILIIIFITLSLDQLTKFIVTKSLSLNQSLPVIKGVFHLTLVYNRGAAFGILKNQLPIFIFTSIFAIILIYFSLRNKTTYTSLHTVSTFRQGHGRQRKFYIISLSLILAGALGNLIDRLFFGYVIDFLDFRIWPVFNVADSAISIGAILLGWSVFRESKK
jgi:signal peptidase II